MTMLYGYEYDDHDKPGDTAWPDCPGVYVFLDSTPWHERYLYVGQTESFSERLPCHDRWEDAARLGANRISILAVSDPFERTEIEHLLIEQLQPPLNKKG